MTAAVDYVNASEYTPSASHAHPSRDTHHAHDGGWLPHTHDGSGRVVPVHEYDRTDPSDGLAVCICGAEWLSESNMCEVEWDAADG